MSCKPVIFVLPFALLFSGCLQESLTVAEVRQALEEITLADQALAVTSSTVEISTNFTIGQAVEAAAAELRDFIESQLPCAEISLVGAKLTIEYGANPGNCTFHGQTYSGSHSIEITSAAEGDLIVHHDWDQISNSKLTVSGTANVTWSTAAGSRTIVHQLEWTRLSDGKQVFGSGDRTQTTLPAGITEGIAITGERHWTTSLGIWDLEIDDIEVRWIDPVPQSGVYRLTTPFNGKSASLSFWRRDENTIAVTVTSGPNSFIFDVSKSGAISQP